MDTSGLLSELDALNICLYTIGGAPVSALDAGGVDVAKAKDTLKEVSRSVQEEGWSFNTDRNKKLLPDIDGYINLPTNTLKVDTVGSSAYRDLIQRGYRLYDKENNTFVIGEPVYVDIVLFLDWEELPQAARQYIAIKAARLFHKRVLGSEAIDTLTREDEARAERRFLLSVSQTEDLNIFNHPEMLEIIWR